MMTCVVGNCSLPGLDVKRCYWAMNVGRLRGTLEDHAYLDLCSFHQGLFEPHTCGAWVQGWEPTKEDSNEQG